MNARVARDRRPAWRVRAATPSDAAAIAAIYNEGIEDRIATFETQPRRPSDILGWFDDAHPIVVVGPGAPGPHAIVAFAATSVYRPRDAYEGVAEFSVYVARAARGQGAGRAAMDGLIEAAERSGFWKLVSRVLVENEPSRRLLAQVGFREVGTYRRHARLDGRWRDAVIVERLLGPAADDWPRRGPGDRTGGGPVAG